jgi:hypothetical protein
MFVTAAVITLVAAQEPPPAGSATRLTPPSRTRLTQ